jgi:4-amino-4-deoxy-L-arabinose transferase-like glycosyltransferase
MTSQYETETPHSLAEQVSGIVDDAQEVIKQQLNLFQAEFKTTIRNHIGVGIGLALALGTLSVAAVTIAFAVAYGMASAWQLPLWGAFAIVAGILVAATVALAWWTWHQFTTISLLPDNKAEGLKENHQWTTTTK